MPSLLPGLPEQTRLHLGTGKPPSRGSQLSSSGCTPGRGHPPSSCSHRRGQETGQRENRRKRRAGNFGVIMPRASNRQPDGGHAGTVLCPGRHLAQEQSHLRLQSPPSQLCSAIRHLIMQQDAIAQFLQVSGPALTPAGTESLSAAPAASFLPSIPRQKHFLHMQLPVSAGHGTARLPAQRVPRTRLSLRGPWRLCSPTCGTGSSSAGLVPAQHPSAARCPWSSTDPAACRCLMEEAGEAAARFPEGPLARRLGTSQEGLSSPRTGPGAGSQCRSRVWPLHTWYSSAIPTSLPSGSSAPSSAEPFCPSWELLPESVLLLRDESRESSSVRSMVVTGMDVARRRLELCAAEGAER